jgi:hypothetical protein
MVEIPFSDSDIFVENSLENAQIIYDGGSGKALCFYEIQKIVGRGIYNTEVVRR